MPPTENVSARSRTRDQIAAVVLASGELTRTEIVALTGLSRSTVNHAVARLLATGTVIETAAESKGPGSGSGRPGLKVRPAPSGHFVAGIDFGHAHIHAALADGLGREIAEDRVALPVDLRAVEALDLAADLIRTLQHTAGIDTLATVVAGIPGPLDVRTGLVCSPTILSSWVGMAPTAELERRLGVRVHAENDAYLGAYGELRGGAGQNLGDFLYVKVSHGIGANPVINGAPYRGATGISGEIGHTHLPGRTELCRCGQRGCLEAAVTVDSIREQISHAHPGMDTSTIPLGDLDNPMTRRIFDEAGRTVGRVLADLSNLLNPRAVVLGGEIGVSGPAFVSGVTSSLLRFAAPAIAGELQVVPAALGERSELTGALLLAATVATR